MRDVMKQRTAALKARQADAARKIAERQGRENPVRSWVATPEELAALRKPRPRSRHADRRGTGRGDAA